MAAGRRAAGRMLLLAGAAASSWSQKRMIDRSIGSPLQTVSDNEDDVVHRGALNRWRFMIPRNAGGVREGELPQTQEQSATCGRAYAPGAFRRGVSLSRRRDKSVIC